MNRRNWRKVMVVLWLAGGFLLVLWPAGARAGGAEWEWQNPLPTGNWLRGIWGSSGSDVFAVGGGATIMHYDGTYWSAMGSGTTKLLESVWGSSGSDVFAVGSYGTILHYSGRRPMIYLPLVLRNSMP